MKKCPKCSSTSKEKGRPNSSGIPRFTNDSAFVISRVNPHFYTGFSSKIKRIIIWYFYKIRYGPRSCKVEGIANKSLRRERSRTIRTNNRVCCRTIGNGQRWISRLKGYTLSRATSRVIIRWGKDGINQIIAKC